jgi:hypothetical protein
VEAKFFISTFVLIVLMLVSNGAFATDFGQCYRDKVLTSNDTFGWVQTTEIHLDNDTDPRGQWGVPVNDSTRSVPLSVRYDRCTRDCTDDPEPPYFTDFSNQFTTWLIPWIALLSQLPFGANNAADNLLSVLLAVGSPTLAGYSLALTVLNGRWLDKHIQHILKRFGDDSRGDLFSNVQIVLDRLQQMAFVIKTEDQQLGSLVLLQSGHRWWKKMEEGLRYPSTWTISAVTNIAWVFITYVITVVDAFYGLGMDSDIFGLGPGHFPNSQADGQVVGGVWLWLLPVVMGWMLVSPKCDHDANTLALRESDRELLGLYTEEPKITTKAFGSKVDSISRAIEPCTEMTGFHRDENCSAPIFNYTRFITWTQGVETVLSAYYSAFYNKERGLGIEDMPEQRPGRWREGDDPENGKPLYPPSKGAESNSLSLW